MARTKFEGVIVALTSFGSRMKYATEAIESILNGTRMPDKIIITLTEKDAENMPESLRRLVEQEKVELITTVDDMKGHKKYFYVAQKYKSSPIILIDDDWRYDPKLVETLMNAYEEHPDMISCCWTRDLFLDESCRILPYKELQRRNVEIERKAGASTQDAFHKMILGGSGTILPPNCLKIKPSDAAIVEKYPTVDDLVILYFAKRNKMGVNTVYGITNTAIEREHPEIYNVSLYKTANSKVDENGDTPNDLALRELINPFFAYENGVSVCISAYHTKDYIKDTLDSVAEQTWFSKHSNYEIIVGIDGDEELAEYVQSIMGMYRNLRVYMMDKNSGTYVTSNTMMKKANYPYVVRFDSDDVMYPNMIETLMGVADQYDFVQYHCNHSGKSVAAIGSSMIRKSVFDEFGGYRPWVCSGDADLMVRLRQFVRYVRMHDVLYNYNVRQGSLTQSTETDNKSEIRQQYAEFINTTKYETRSDACIKMTTGRCHELSATVEYSDADKVVPRKSAQKSGESKPHEIIVTMPAQTQSVQTLPKNPKAHEIIVDLVVDTRRHRKADPVC